MWDSLLLTLQSDTDTSKYSLHLLSLFLNFLLPLQKASKQNKTKHLKSLKKTPKTNKNKNPTPNWIILVKAPKLSQPVFSAAKLRIGPVEKSPLLLNSMTLHIK